MKEKNTWQIVSAVIAIIAVAVTVWIHFDTKNSVEKKTVETLAGYFDSVDKDMSYDLVLKTVYEDSKRLKEDNNTLKDELEILKGQVSTDEFNKTAIENSYPKKLSDIFVVDSVGYEHRNDLFTDSFGNHYTGTHVLRAGNFGVPYVVFNVDKKYDIFSAKMVLSPETRSEFVFIVQVFADDKLIYIKDDFNKRMGAINLDLDITGATTLTIKMNISNDVWNSGEGFCIYFVDATISTT